MTRGAAIAAAIVAALVSSALVWSATRAKPRHPWATTVCVTHGAPTKSDPRGSERLLAAAVRTLTAEERDSLERALALSVTRWEARANPLLEDIEGIDPDRSLGDWLRTAPVSSRIARTAMRREICTLDGLCVRAGSNPECPAGWAPPQNAADEDRARFLAWPWGKAIRFRAKSAEDAHRAAAVLRERARTATSASAKPIGLVLAADDLDVAREPPLAHLRELWRRQAVLAAIAAGRHGEAVRAAEDDADLPISEPRDLVVLPRLDRVAEETTFIAAVLEAAPGLVVVGRP